MRHKAKYRISVKNLETGENHKIELIPQPFCKKYAIRYQGKNSDKLPVATKTQISNEIRKFLK